MPARRHHALDYLRGCMAVSVMLYHYYSWYTGDIEAYSVLAKLGIYAVSIFYILSGLSLSLAYANKLSSRSGIASYTVKRVFRIFPLFWLATSIHLVFQLVKSAIDSSYTFDGTAHEMVMNYSLLFGFFDPSGYIAVGAWSIGNEIVFYALFPFVMWLSTFNRALFLLGWVFSFVPYVYFSFFVLSDTHSLGEQWVSYVNPFNQFFLFYSGVVTGVYLKNISPSIVKLILAMLALVILFYFMTGGDSNIYLVVGFSRVGFSVLAILFVACVFMSKWYLRGAVGQFFDFLGESSYSIYLLHPLVSFPVIFVFTQLGLNLFYGYVVSLILTLFCSYLSYHFLEKPGIFVGKEVASKLQCFLGDGMFGKSKNVI